MAHEKKIKKLLSASGKLVCLAAAGKRFWHRRLSPHFSEWTQDEFAGSDLMVKKISKVLFRG
jgi:hypothetical protein